MLGSGPAAPLVSNRPVLREPHRAAHSLIEIDQNPLRRVTLGDGAADHGTRYRMRAIPNTREPGIDRPIHVGRAHQVSQRLGGIKEHGVISGFRRSGGTQDRMTATKTTSEYRSTALASNGMMWPENGSVQHG